MALAEHLPAQRGEQVERQAVNALEGRGDGYAGTTDRDRGDRNRVTDGAPEFNPEPAALIEADQAADDRRGLALRVDPEHDLGVERRRIGAAGRQRTVGAGKIIELCPWSGCR